MRLLVASVLALSLTACSQTPATPLAVDVPPLASDEEAASSDGACGDRPAYVITSTRTNASLAGDFYREAQRARSPEAARDAYCAASVYLRWLLAHEPTFTGGAPDDRHYRRMADVYEFFASVDTEDRRAYLDSALVLREEADDARRELGLDVDPWASSVRTGLFYHANADAYADARRREFDAFDEAFRLSPDQIDDWYLRRLVELSSEFFDSCESRAEYLRALLGHIDDEQLRAYVEAVSDCRPAEVPPPRLPLLVRAFAEGELSDCEPDEEVRVLIGLAARQPDLVREAGGDPDGIVDDLLDCVAEPDTAAQAFALFVRSWNRGDRVRAEAYFQTALDLAETSRERADLCYARVARDMGEQCTRRALDDAPAHGPLLYLQASRLASAIGEPVRAHARAAYWCLADEFSRVAATGDPRVADTARRQAQEYERAAPTREQYIFETDWRPGDTIQARSGGVSCTTRVR